MIKKIILFLLLSIFIACGTTEPIIVVITHIEKESTKWGCLRVDTRTWVKTEDNRIDYVCGTIGQPGDTISGYWTTGSLGKEQNGFRLNK